MVSFPFSNHSTQNSKNLLVPPDGCFVQIHVYLLCLQIFFETPGSQLSAEARLLISAPWRFHIGGLHVIDPDDSGSHRLDYAKRLENITSPNGAGQTIWCVIRDFDGFAFILEWND